MSKIKSNPIEVKVLTAIATNPEKRAVRAELGVPYPSIQEMIEANLIRVAGKVETKKRGRPALKYGLTDKGRKRANRLTAA